ncbi:sugar-binding protein [Actinotalea subterranea]|uniref:sugar-binding protein n=1 Tax=Actinotalea subterranea TaxID=2607497 RepID=UPI0011EBD28F|nr:sugar-binding protein [Actinotalea subterranea]
MKRTGAWVFVSALVVGALALPPVAYGSPAPAAAAVDPSPLVVETAALPSGAGAAGALDLTAVGGVDWVHVTGSGTERKAATPSIEITNLAPDSPIGTLTDSPYRYEWSDGTPTTTATGLTTGGVFGDGRTTTGPVDLDAGYRVAVPAADTVRRLVVVGGIWQAGATVSVAPTGISAPVYETQVTASDEAKVRTYTVTLRPGEGAVLTARLTEKLHADGNVSFAAATLQAVDPSAAGMSLASEAPPQTMDLTSAGSIDWLHLAGPTINRSATGSGALAVANRAAGTAIRTQSDNPVVYRWTNGTPLAEQAGTRTGGVFLADSTDFTRPYGWDLTVEADDRERTLQLVTGVWQASAVISVYRNGESTPEVVSAPMSAAGTPVSQLLTLTLPAGDSALITGQLTGRTNSNGNITLAGVTLDESPAPAEALRLLLDEVAGTDLVEADAAGIAQLEREVAAAEALLADGGADVAALRLQHVFLEAAFREVLGSVTRPEYAFQSSPELVSSFGWEGDRHAPIAYIDGSYRLRDRGDLMVTFGVPSIPGKIEWRNAEGYLPAFISEYSKRGLDVRVQSFADEVTIDGNRFEIAYSRMTTTNTTASEMRLPVVSEELVPLDDAASRTVVGPGETVVRDFAIAADRFNGTYAWPTGAQVAALGGYDEHYAHMRDYWNTRLAAIADITALPNPELIDAYKAGYIYTLLIRDDIDGNKQLHVGENGYDIMFDHDTIGIVATLLTIGDFTYAKDYLATLPAQLQYDDAKWKYSWPFALYLQRTGDVDFIRSQFENIKKQTHMVETDRIDGGTGIMKQTNAIDSLGYWTIDNWSALAGLTTYRYLAESLGETEEAAWAQAEYDDLLGVATGRLQQTIDEFGLDYIPISMVEPNETGPRSDPRDANWASMFLFGRWAWDGYLFGADQSGLMLDWIDQTYAHGFERRAEVSDTIHNFGGYPHGFYSSAYNAGYGSSALRGEQFRDSGIRAYEFMIDKAQSGPFGWWEGVDYPAASSPWSIDHAAGGGGSNQHMWGQSTATKVLFDSLIAQRSDGTVIIGRGIPQDWLTTGSTVALDRYPVLDDGRVGFSMSSTGTDLTVDLTGDVGAVEAFSIELIGLKDNIARVSTPGASVDEAAGVVRVPADAGTVTISMRHEVGAEGEPLAASIEGTAKVGETLHARVTDGWTPASYQWTRDGEPLTSATGADYRLDAADAGAMIGVRVEASRPGWSDAEAEATAVGPVAPSLHVTVGADARCVGWTVWLGVTVTNADTTRVDARVSTEYGTKTLRNVRPGRSVSRVFPTWQRWVPGGSVRVEVKPAFGGHGAGQAMTARYPAVSCR